jgi:ribonucleoside-triphosphate reductase
MAQSDSAGNAQTEQAQGVFPEWKHFLGTSKDPETASFIRNVVKRSGEIMVYDRVKIEYAIDKAISAVEGHGNPDRARELTDKVEENLRGLMAGRHAHSIPAIEEIQDIVESVLIEQQEVQVAKAYILYRARHEAIRDAERLMLDIDDTMNGYLSQSDWRVKENANVNFSLGGLILHNSGTITANYWLKNIYPEEVAEAHRSAAFHIHDLSMFSGYCAGWSLRQLIAEGLGGVPDKITSKPPKHLSTLIQQIVNFLGIMQNEWAGAQAFSSFDTYLAPFVKKDNLSDREVKQCLQSFIYGVNTPSRWGSQAPFTNITLDWNCPADLASKNAVVGGGEMAFTYGECQKEMDTINRIFIELMLEGDAAGRGFQYPIPTYNITNDFEWNPLLPELHQFGPQPERRPLHVLPPPARQTRAQETRRRALRLGRIHRLDRRRNDQHAADRLPRENRGAVFRPPRFPHGTGEDQPPAQAQSYRTASRRRTLPVHAALPHAPQ